MNILHIPSWYPSKNNPIRGIFIKKQIEAIRDFDSNTHIVLIWHNTTSYSLKNPVLFVFKLLLTLRKYTVKAEKNIKYINFNYFNSYYSVFGNNEERLQKKITKIAVTVHSKYHVDLIHAHVTYPGGYIAEYMKACFKIPYIITEHMGPFPFDYFKTDFKRKIINPIQNANKVIAVSNFQAKEINLCTGAYPSVIPNVIDEREFTFGNKQNINSDFIFLLVGGLSSIKGVDILIRAIKHLKDQGVTNFKVEIVGNGEILQDLKKLAVEIEVNNVIEWSDGLNRNKVVESFKNSNCFISASRHESFGVALVEALACGKPVISTRSGGPEDTINQENGVLVEKENPVELSKAMKWMMEDIDSFDSFKIRQDYENKYSRKVIAEKYLNIYNEVKNMNI